MTNPSNTKKISTSDNAATSNPKDISGFEEFEEIYSNVRKEALNGYKKMANDEIKKLGMVDRAFTKFPLFWISVTTLLGCVIVVLIGLGLERSGFRSEFVELWITIGALPVQAAILLIVWRSSKFKVGPSGDYRFSLEAIRLKDVYKIKGYTEASLKKALNDYISGKKFGLILSSALSAGLLFFINTNNLLFPESGNVFGKIIVALKLSENQSDSQIAFWLIYGILFFLTVWKFYYPKLRAEQVQGYLNHFCDEEEKRKQ